MNLPHLRQVRYERRWREDKKRECYAVLARFQDIYGPAFILETLAEAVEAWFGEPRFETMRLQRDLQLEAIREAARTCREASDARLALERKRGRNPAYELFIREMQVAGEARDE